jgi:hypothetical protein
MREARARRELVDWLRSTHPEVWRSVPRADRFLSHAAIDRLLNGGRLDDPEFRHRVEEMERLPSVLPPLAAGIIAVAFLFAGSHFFGWAW